jgi:hypothetical protein
VSAAFLPKRRERRAGRDLTGRLMFTRSNAWRASSSVPDGVGPARSVASVRGNYGRVVSQSEMELLEDYRATRCADHRRHDGWTGQSAPVAGHRCSCLSV